MRYRVTFLNVHGYPAGQDIRDIISDHLHRNSTITATDVVSGDVYFDIDANPGEIDNLRNICLNAGLHRYYDNCTIVRI